MSDLDTLVDGFQAAWSDHDPGAFAAVCAPDLHYEDPMTVEPLESPEALAAHAARLCQAFPDARMERTGERLGDGRFVAAPVKLLATHRGEIEDFPPTGRFVIVHAVFFCELDEARTRLWRVRAFFDLYDAAIQLGVLPKPGSVGERAMLLLRGFGLRSK
ncbi:MAG: ester cyclase [Solirubrobacterales bacterium]|nr:ester cyclase [Solirubrobacterales bacterium]